MNHYEFEEVNKRSDTGISEDVTSILKKKIMILAKYDD